MTFFLFCVGGPRAQVLDRVFGLRLLALERSKDVEFT